MSKPILYQLYDGEIYPRERIKPTTLEYKNLLDEINKEKDYFMNRLSEADRKRFDDFYGLIYKLHGMYSREDFSYGYKLGVRLTCEAFLDKKETSSDKE